MTADESPSAVDLSREPDFEIGGLRVRPSSREVVKDDSSEILEPRAMQALVVLAGRKGEVVSRDDLIARCWGGRIVTDDAISNAVAKVRRLGETHGAFVIETVPRVGYRLSETGETATLTATARPRRWAPILALLVAVVVVASAGIAFWMTRAPSTVRVAVAPFEAVASDRALANRVRDQVAGVLSARLVDVSAKDETRGARLLVSGAVERSGGMAHARFRVEDTKSGLVLWSGEVAGPDGADSPVAERAAAKTGDLVFDAVRVLRSSKGSVSPEAMKAFILGLESWRDVRTLEAVNFYRVFRDKAPNIAESHGIYAQALVSGAETQTPEVAAAWREEARKSAARALAINPSEAAALRTEVALLPPRDFAGRLEIVRRGLETNPNNVDLLSDQGMALTGLGRPREGLSYLRRSLALDPLSPRKNFRVTTHLGMAGLTDEARGALATSLRIWPDSPDVIEDSTLYAVDFAPPDEGLAMIAKLAAENPGYGPQATIWRAYLQSLQCQCGQAAIAQTLRGEVGAGRVDFKTAYTALVRLGRIEEALEVLNVSDMDAASRRMLFAQVNAPLRRDSRFMDVAARLGLAQYWQSSGRWPEFCAEPGLPYDCKTEAARARAARKS